MTDKKLVSHIWIVGCILILICVVGFFSVGQGLSEDQTKKIVSEEISKIQFPTATEIAGEIVIDVPEWDAPVIPEFESDDKVNDLWEDLYSEIIAVLKGNATEDATLELEDLIYEAEDEEDGDFFDFLKLSILNFKEIKVVDWDEEEVEVTVIDLGLGEDEDKVAQVVFELEVEYYLTEGPISDVFEKTVIVTADVVYEEGNFDDEEVELSFVLE